MNYFTVSGSGRWVAPRLTFGRALVMAVAGVLLLSTSAPAQQYTLNIGHVLDTAHPVHIGGLKMAEAAHQLSGGRVKVNIFPSSQLGGAREIIQNTQSGTIAGILESTTKLVPFVPEFAALDMPYLIDPAKAFALLETPVIHQDLGEKAAKAGFRMMHYWEVTFRSIYTRKPVNSITDLKGLKLYTSPSPSFITILRAFGSSPTNIAFAELYTALQQGVVDGADNDALTYLTTRHYEVAKSFAVTNHAMRLNTFIMSERVWKTLPADIQQALKEASLEGQRVLRAYRGEREATVLADLKARGVAITNPDLKPFVDAGRRSYADFEQMAGKEMVGKLLAVIGK